MILSLLTSRIGLLVAAFAAIIIFYEGVPVGPLGKLPFVGAITDGRVDREARRAREGYVSEVRVTAAEARLTELNRQLESGQRIIASYQRTLTEVRAQEAAEDEQFERDRKAFEAKLAAAGRSCALDGDDLLWLDGVSDGDPE